MKSSGAARTLALSPTFELGDYVLKTNFKVLAANSDYICSTWTRGDLLVKENVCHLEPEFMNSLVLIDMFDLCFLKNRLAMNLQNYFLIN